jgi:hypothetical protein
MPATLSCTVSRLSRYQPKSTLISFQNSGNSCARMVLRELSVLVVIVIANTAVPKAKDIQTEAVPFEIRQQPLSSKKGRRHLCYDYSLSSCHCLSRGCLSPEPGVIGIQG